MTAKQPVSFAMRPTLIAKLDKLAMTVDLSRSELACRLLGLYVDNLTNPEVGQINISRDHLLNGTLRV